MVADLALESVIVGVREDRWSLGVRPVFAGRTGLANVVDVVGHHAYDEAWIPDMLAGRTMDEVGRDAYDGDLLGSDPAGSYRRFAVAAWAAGREIDSLEGTVHCSFDCSTEDYLWQLIAARSLTAEAIARSLGAESPLTEDLAGAVWTGLSPRAAAWRRVGVLHPEVLVPASASMRVRLPGLTGQTL